MLDASSRLYSIYLFFYFILVYCAIQQWSRIVEWQLFVRL